MNARNVFSAALEQPIRFGVSTLAIFLVALFGFRAVGFVPYFVDGTESSRDKEITALVNEVYSVPLGHTVALAHVPQLGDEDATTLETAAATVAAPEILDRSVTPTRIVIGAVGIDVPILNPTSTDVDVLDKALLSGSVRYPGSGRIGEDGNIFIFAHTSHLPVVHNQMFKAFNNLPDLEKNDLIKVEGEGAVALYRVREVRLTDANEELVNLKPNSRVLTLATCNTFGEKSSRWVVEADFVGEYATDGR